MTARDTLAAYADRINRHDFDLLTDLIAADASFWFSDGTHRGIAPSAPPSRRRGR